MPSVKPPQPNHFEPVKPTAEKLNYADLPTLDFAELKNGDAGKSKLAETLNKVMRTQGFFYIVNHGLSEEEVTRQVDIGYTVLTETPLEEKMKLVSQMQEKGCYRGFKLRDYYQYYPGKTFTHPDFKMALSIKSSNTIGVEIWPLNRIPVHSSHTFARQTNSHNMSTKTYCIHFSVCFLDLSNCLMKISSSIVIDMKSLTNLG